MGEGEIQFLIILVSLSFLSILVLLASLMFYLSKKKAQFIIEKERAKMAFEEQLLKTEIEITEQNLKNISWELHDNIGQLMSVAAIEIELLSSREVQFKTELKEVGRIIKNCMDQIRGISKTLNRDMVLKAGLKDALENEVERIERLGLLKVDFICPDEVSMDEKFEVIVFRMIQEFISNTLKHAGAENLKIIIEEDPTSIQIMTSDDGQGFHWDNQKKGSGMTNLEQRAKMMNAEFLIESSGKGGTKMSLLISKKHSTYEN